MLSILQSPLLGLAFINSTILRKEIRQNYTGQVYLSFDIFRHGPVKLCSFLSGNVIVLNLFLLHARKDKLMMFVCIRDQSTLKNFDSSSHQLSKKKDN